MKKRRLIYLLPIISLLLSVYPVISVIAATPTPQATETIAPTLTPYMPPVCATGTSVFPTADFSTPTGILPTVTGTPGTATPSPTPSPSPTPYGCPPFTITARDYTAGFGASNTAELFECENITAGHVRCQAYFTGLRESWFWGATYSYINFQLNDVPSGTTVYISYFDTYTDNNGSASYVALPGLGTCVAAWGFGQPSSETCTTIVDDDTISLKWLTGGTGDLPIESNITLTMDVALSESCLADHGTATPTPNPCAPAEGEVLPGEPIAIFNPPMLTSAGCYEVLNPIDLDLPDISWSPFELPPSVPFPGWRICIQLATASAVFAGVDWIGILGGILTMISIGGIYVVLQRQ